MLQIRKWRLSCSQGPSSLLPSRAQCCPDWGQSGYQRGVWPGGAELPQVLDKTDRELDGCPQQGLTCVFAPSVQGGHESLLMGVFSSQ